MATIKKNNFTEVIEDVKDKLKSGKLAKDIVKDKAYRIIQDDLSKVLKSEVDKANKRLKRMNNFQRGIFEDKGITHISRKGTLEDKLKALSQARIVNESGISTKREYNKYVSKLSQELSLKTKEVDYMLNQFDSRKRDFISRSPLKYGSNPQIDFLFEDVIELNNTLQHNLDAMDYNLVIQDKLTEEILKATNEL